MFITAMKRTEKTQRRTKMERKIPKSNTKYHKGRCDRDPFWLPLYVEHAVRIELTLGFLQMVLQTIAFPFGHARILIWRRITDSNCHRFQWAGFQVRLAPCAPILQNT